MVIYVKKIAIALFLLWFCSPAFAVAQEEVKATISELMPLPKDETSMWWRDGFPGIIDGAAWRRIVRTGSYWFLFDTETVSIPRLGPVETPLGEIDGVDLKLNVEVNGESYRCRKGSEWSSFSGPRLIESGNLLQRTDVWGLEFVSKDGKVLNAESRFESAAWSDQLGFSLAVRPGPVPFLEGEQSGGRVAGGFGLTGRNRFDIPSSKCVEGSFTLGFWVFVPRDYKAELHAPWLVCQNRNETVDGNFGIVLGKNAVPVVRMNLGGGVKNARSFKPGRHQSLKVNQWNHVALSYDNQTVKLAVDGRTFVEEKVGKTRKALPGGLAIGTRQDGLPGFGFRGVIDEVFLFDRALSLPEIRSLKRSPEKDLSRVLKPKHVSSFQNNLPQLKSVRRENWQSASIEVAVGGNAGRPVAAKKWTLPQNQTWNSDRWEKASLLFDPLSLQQATKTPASVSATDVTSNKPVPVSYDADLGCYRIGLDQVKPAVPIGEFNPRNDQMERVRIRLANSTGSSETVRLMFEKTPIGFRQSPGQSVTGISAVIRDSQGNPTGIPVQLSKNWHTSLDGGVHSGLWFHGISQVRIPARKKAELELSIVYGHWGKVAAASHAQLSLIGYGGNHLWEQSAVGSWGESICYNPEQVFGHCNVTDIRPLMVKAADDKKWNWTHNVGGADFLRMFDLDEKRVAHARVQSNVKSPGPCLTDVTHKGQVGKTGIQYSINSSLPRTDDLIRATWRIRMCVTKPTDFSRFVFFQAGSDKYAYTEDQKMAVGDVRGVKREWLTEGGDNTYRVDPLECVGAYPWASLHKTLGQPGINKGGWATRGVIVRKWNAKLGGKPAKPWFAEHGSTIGRRKVSTMDLVPPPGVKKFLPGDYVNATIEFVVIPQYANEYYGPNEPLRTALNRDQDSWKMVWREAVQGHLKFEMLKGTLSNVFPGVEISTENNSAEFELKGGLGYVPVKFTNLSRHSGYILKVDGKPVDQNVHGNDFWQTEYDPELRRWSQTYNLKSVPGGARISFESNL